MGLVEGWVFFRSVFDKYVLVQIAMYVCTRLTGLLENRDDTEIGNQRTSTATPFQTAMY